MPEEVSIKEDLQIIHIKSVNEVTVRDLKLTLSKILKFKEVKGFTRIFVDHSETTSFPSVVDAFNFGADISQLFKKTSIALVASKRTERDIEFFRDVVNARGGNVQIFYSEEPAIQWLTAQPS